MGMMSVAALQSSPFSACTAGRQQKSGRTISPRLCQALGTTNTTRGTAEVEAETLQVSTMTGRHVACHQRGASKIIASILVVPLITNICYDYQQGSRQEGSG